jgi:archaellum component FlaC
VPPKTIERFREGSASAELSDAVESASDAVDTGTTAVDTLPDSVETVTTAVETVSDAVDTLSDAVETVADAVETVSTAVDTLPDAVETVTDAVETVSDAVETGATAVDTVSDTVETLTDAVETVAEACEKRAIIAEIADFASFSTTGAKGAMDSTGVAGRGSRIPVALALALVVSSRGNGPMRLGELMLWPPEMELVDQLSGGRMPLTVVVSFFESHDRARNVLSIYIAGHAINFYRGEQLIPEWQAQQLLRETANLEQTTDILVDLTDVAAEAFHRGSWESFFRSKGQKP